MLHAPKWLLVAILIIGAANLLTITGTYSILAAGNWPDLPFAPGVRIAFAAVWLAIMLALLIGLLRRQRIAFFWMAPLLTLYGLANVLWTIIFAHSDYSHGALGFQIALSVLALVPVWWVAIRRGWMR